MVLCHGDMLEFGAKQDLNLPKANKVITYLLDVAVRFLVSPGD